MYLCHFNLHYFSLWNNLNNFYENPYEKSNIILLHDYFNTHCKITSTIAAIVLVFLTPFKIWNLNKSMILLEHL